MTNDIDSLQLDFKSIYRYRRSGRSARFSQSRTLSLEHRMLRELLTLRRRLLHTGHQFFYSSVVYAMQGEQGYIMNVVSVKTLKVVHEFSLGQPEEKMKLPQLAVVNVHLATTRNIDE